MDTNDVLQEMILKIEALQKTLASSGTQENVSENRFLKFTEQEIIQMPKTFRKEFRAQGCTAHIRKRTNGRYTCSYEIRYTRNGYSLSASATTLEEAKKRFIAKLDTAIPKEQNGLTCIPTSFDKFAWYWFENFHKRKVKETTYTQNTNLYKRYIQAVFGKHNVKAITPIMLQSFLDGFNDKGKTADDLYSLLNQIFASTVKHGLIKLNPLGMCFHKQHEKEHGKALSKDEEAVLLEAYDGIARIQIAVALYTGLRPNEYVSATIDGNFIKAVNSKRKGGKIEYKRIPISPMLRPYLQNVSELVMPSVGAMLKRIKKVLPYHKSYDLRTTFQTRCTECGIPDAVIGVFMGNSIGKLKDAYTDFSDEYLLSESEKLTY